MSGSSTLNPKKHRQWNYRQSSMPKLGPQEDYGTLHRLFLINYNNVCHIIIKTKKYNSIETDGQQNYMSLGMCRSESLNIQLEVPPGQTSGLAVHDENAILIISHVATQSPAYR